MLTRGELNKLFAQIPQGYDGFELIVKCHDCGKEFPFRIAKIDGEYYYGGGSIYDVGKPMPLFKCDACFAILETIEAPKVVWTEVYSRIVGYYRPIEQWNSGKAAEFSKRKMFRPVFREIN